MLRKLAIRDLKIKIRTSLIVRVLRQCAKICFKIQTSVDSDYHKAPKPVLNQDWFEKKIMLCVFWYFEGVLHFELVLDGKAFDPKLYTEHWLGFMKS